MKRVVESNKKSKIKACYGIKFKKNKNIKRVCITYNNERGKRVCVQNENLLKERVTLDYKDVQNQRVLKVYKNDYIQRIKKFLNFSILSIDNMSKLVYSLIKIKEIRRFKKWKR